MYIGGKIECNSFECFRSFVFEGFNTQTFAILYPLIQYSSVDFSVQANCYYFVFVEGQIVIRSIVICKVTSTQQLVSRVS